MHMPFLAKHGVRLYKRMIIKLGGKESFERNLL
jgi:hypothetical protein